ncbi:MAG: CvpA family protein [Proteobacteria bacterium]|nr:CvpA family protein [Pseudomonadota bacterium]
MTTVDYSLIAIVLISLLFGAIRGFLRESVALLGWLVGLWLAWRYAPAVQPYLGGSLTGTELQVWVARMILLLVAVLSAWILGSLLVTSCSARDSRSASTASWGVCSAWFVARSSSASPSCWRRLRRCRTNSGGKSPG